MADKKGKKVEKEEGADQTAEEATAALIEDLGGVTVPGGGLQSIDPAIAGGASEIESYSNMPRKEEKK